MTVRVVTDSACDLRGDEVSELGIEVVPLSIRFGSEEFIDREELTVEDFYRRLYESESLPETAAPSPGRFEQAFRRQLEAGADTVVCIDLSAELSATMQSARTAASAIDADIRVLDSRSVSAGLGSITLAAARLAAEGASVDEVVAAVESMSERTHVYGTLDTLEYLKKGGRIGGAKAMLGSMLSFKPALDISGGVVEEAGKPRTRKKALAWLRDTLEAALPVENLAVMHGEAPDLEQFLEMLEPLVDVAALRIEKIGAVIGTHAGPRVMGLAFQDLG